MAIEVDVYSFGLYHRTLTYDAVEGTLRTKYWRHKLPRPLSHSTSVAHFIGHVMKSGNYKGIPCAVRNLMIKVDDESTHRANKKRSIGSILRGYPPTGKLKFEIIGVNMAVTVNFIGSVTIKPFLYCGNVAEEFSKLRLFIREHYGADLLAHNIALEGNAVCDTTRLTSLRDGGWYTFHCQDRPLQDVLAEHKTRYDWPYKKARPSRWFIR